MSRSTVLQIVAAIILLLSGVLFYQYITIEDKTVSILPGTGAAILGITLLFMSRSKQITGKKS